MPAPPDRKALIAKVKEAAKQIGRDVITLAEFRSVTGISRHQVHQHFDSYSQLLRTAGLTTFAQNRRIPDDDLLRAMSEAFRKTKGLVPLLPFSRHCRYSPAAYQRRWGGWSATLQAFRKWQPEHDPDFPYASQIDSFRAGGTLPRRRALLWTSRGGRQYGEALNFRGLLHTPVNEQGVIFLFATLAADLGFLIDSLTSEFPDCEAKRRVGKTWERVRIEFEHESRNFRTHRHDPEGCDLIVCWEHNWPECPLEVLELRKVVREMVRPDALATATANATRCG